MNLQSNGRGRQNLRSNGNVQRSKKKNAVKRNSNVKRLLVKESINENESKLQLKLMPKRVLPDRLSRRGDLKWRRPSRTAPHPQLLGLNPVGMSSF